MYDAALLLPFLNIEKMKLSFLKYPEILVKAIVYKDVDAIISIIEELYNMGIVISGKIDEKDEEEFVHRLMIIFETLDIDCKDWTVDDIQFSSSIYM
jgi:hypothetical protein